MYRKIKNYIVLAFLSMTSQLSSAQTVVPVEEIDAYENAIYADNAVGSPGQPVTISINMKNATIATGYSFYLELPTDIDPNSVSIKKSTTRKADEVSQSKAVQSDGSIMVVAYASDGQPFSGNDGEVVTASFTVPETMEVGEYTVVIKKAEISKNGVPIGVDETFVSTLTVTNEENNYEEGYSLQLHPFKAINGQDYDEEAESGNLFVELQFQNIASVSNLEFDILLPDGVTIGSYLYNAGTPKKPVWVEVYDPYYAGNYTSEEIFPSAEDNEDGTIHVISEDAIFQPSTSLVSVISLPITVDESVSDGIYNIEILNIVADGTISIAPYSADIYIGANPTATPDQNGAVEYHGNYDDADALDLLNASLPANGVTAIDLTAVTAVAEGKTINTANNPNALILTKTDLGLANDANVVVDGTCANLVLTDKKPFYNTKAFTALSASYTREMPDHKWGTLVLPFEAKANETAQVYTMIDVTTGGDGVMTFEKAESSAAYVPCIIKKLGGDAVTFTAANASIAVTGGTNSMSAATSVDGWSLVGTMSELDFTIGAESLYFINGDHFWKAKTSLHVDPFRAYFNTSGPAPAKFRIAEGTNGIEVIETEQQMAPVYNMQGIRVNVPQNGQVMISESKMFIVK